MLLTMHIKKKIPSHVTKEIEKLTETVGQGKNDGTY